MAHFKMTITGASWLHHNGSITQTTMKLERGLNEKDDPAYRYNYKLLNQSWLERKLTKVAIKKQGRNWRNSEIEEHSIFRHHIKEINDFKWL